MKNENDNLVRVSKARPEEVAELVKKAKGTRSGLEYSQIIGIEPSTLSRLLCGHRMNGLSFDLMSRIAFTAEPGSGVTLHALATASGFVLRDVEAAVELRNKMFARFARESSGATFFSKPKTQIIHGLSYSPLDLVLESNGHSIGYVFLFSSDLTIGNSSAIGEIVDRTSKQIVIEALQKGAISVDEIDVYLNEELVFNEVRQTFSNGALQNSYFSMKFILTEAYATDERDSFSVDLLRQ